MTIQHVAARLVELCRDGKFLQAIDELYDDNIVSTELMSMPNMPAEISGKVTVRGKSEWWMQNNIVHACGASDPLVADDWFSVLLTIDSTAKATQKRTPMKEIALYQVKNGKIVAERFFYAVS